MGFPLMDNPLEREAISTNLNVAEYSKGRRRASFLLAEFAVKRRHRAMEQSQGLFGMFRPKDAFLFLEDYRHAVMNRGN